MRKRIFVSREDGEPWLPVEAESLSGEIEVDDFVRVSGGGMFFVIEFDGSNGFGVISSSGMRALRPGIANGGVLVALSGFGTWPSEWGREYPYEEVVRAGPGLGSIVIKE